jgi:hypothetical protein
MVPRHDGLWSEVENPGNGGVMMCSYTREEVTALILEVFRSQFGTMNIHEDTPLGDDGLGADGDAKGFFFFPIKMSVEKVNCTFKQFSPETCRRAETVGEIIDAAFSDLQA